MNMNIIKYVCVRSFYIVTSYDFTSNHAQLKNFGNIVANIYIRTHTLHAFVRILKIRTNKEKGREKNQHARTKMVTQIMVVVVVVVVISLSLVSFAMLTVAGPACIKRVYIFG